MPSKLILFFKLAFNSLKSRKGSVLLTLLAVTVSVYVLIGVEQIRTQAKQSFSNTITGTDLIIGARTGEINLLLYAVFHMGSATQNISWQTYKNISTLDSVEWAVPISLGDSHQGYRVTATSPGYFNHYHYGDKQALQFTSGQPFDGVYEVVLGAEVAKKLNYTLGDKIILSHGLVSTRFNEHKDKPFKVIGILNATGTPVDRSLYISLQGMEAIHLGGNQAQKVSDKDDNRITALEPNSITAVLVGLKQKTMTFRLQRVINQYQQEALLAILPGVTLAKMWQITGAMEKSLLLIAALILVSSLLGLVAMLLASIRERQHEIAVMRAMGASPWFIFLLIEMEVLIVTLTAYIAGLFSLGLSFALAKTSLIENYGLNLTIDLFAADQLRYLAIIVVAAIFAGLIPAIKAYKQALIKQLR
jgi:putative ABC transport system permease protein